jgi:hypothetical protein
VNDRESPEGGGIQYLKKIHADFSYVPLLGNAESFFSCTFGIFAIRRLSYRPVLNAALRC